jgi:hypothetical protein
VLARAAAALALATLAVVAATPGSDGPRPAAAQTVNHAAVVIDTGDGQVRKMCLTFSESELDGIEVLRRVDTRPYRFEAFGSKGAGVCMLCGVGCPSGDCFCDPAKYWAYHRAGPGGEPYQASRVGASSTKVRNGDVEGWKWGKGDAPPPATVSEVCGVEEPPRRTTAATTTSSPTTAPAEPTTSTPTTPRQEERPPPTTIPPAPLARGGVAPTTSTTATPAPTTAIPGDTPEAAPGETQVAEADAAPSAAEVKRSLGAEDGAAAAPSEKPQNGSEGTVATIAVFGAAMAGLLAWRARLRRAKVREVRPVR